MPDAVYRHSDLTGGTGITRDDDPRNLPAKVYLLVLLLAIILAVAIAAIVLR